MLGNKVRRPATLRASGLLTRVGDGGAAGLLVVAQASRDAVARTVVFHRKAGPFGGVVLACTLFPGPRVGRVDGLFADEQRCITAAAGWTDRYCAGCIGELACAVAVPLSLAVLRRQIAEHPSKLALVEHIKTERRIREGIHPRRILKALPYAKGKFRRRKPPSCGIESNALQAHCIGRDG